MQVFTRLFALILLLGLPSHLIAAEPLTLHPQNPHYFLFRGKPTVLITSGEHYGAVMNLDFDFIPYLNELKARKFNLTRLFSGTYREVPGSFKIQANTLAPRSDRFCGPYARSTTSGATDGGNKFDLNRWNTAYFDRLRTFCKEAEDRGIVVEFVLFCPFYEENLWAINAWHPHNNINSFPDIPSNKVYALARPEVTERQTQFVRKVVTELNAFDNVYFEICNEPYFGGVTLAWQAVIAETIIATEKSLPHRHLIAQNIANESAKIEHPNPAVSLFNFHYARPPKTIELNYDLNKALGDDETGFQGTGDYVYRAEAWDFMLAGGSLFSHLDYSFTTDHEDGSAKIIEPTPGGGGPEFRAQLAYLKAFLQDFDFIKMKPDPTVIVGIPKGSTARALAESGKAYALYIKGKSRGDLSLKLPDGSYRYEWHDPRTRKVLKQGDVVTKGGRVVLSLPEFVEDIALKLIKRDGS